VLRDSSRADRRLSQEDDDVVAVKYSGWQVCKFGLLYSNQIHSPPTCFPCDLAIRRAVANSKKNVLKFVARFNDEAFKGSGCTAGPPSGVDSRKVPIKGPAMAPIKLEYFF